MRADILTSLCVIWSPRVLWPVLWPQVDGWFIRLVVHLVCSCACETQVNDKRCENTMATAEEVVGLSASVWFSPNWLCVVMEMNKCHV